MTDKKGKSNRDPDSIVHWTIESEEDKPYPMATYFRCMHIEEFINKVQEKHAIVGFTFEGNNIGFILGDK